MEKPRPSQFGQAFEGPRLFINKMGLNLPFSTLGRSINQRLQIIARTLPISAYKSCCFTCYDINSFQTQSLASIFSITACTWLTTRHLPTHIFHCAVHVCISPLQFTKMGPQSCLWIYVGFNSPSIIRYFESLMGDHFTVVFYGFSL